MYSHLFSELKFATHTDSIHFQTAQILVNKPLVVKLHINSSRPP